MVLENPLDALKKKTNIFDYAANNFSVPEKKEQYMTPIPKPKTTQPIQQTTKPTTIQQKTAQNFNLQPKFESKNLFDAQRSEKPLEEMGALEKRQELYKRYGYQTTSLGQLADSFQSRFVDTIGASARGVSDMGFGAISDLVSAKSYESAPAQLALGGGPIINLVTAKIKNYLKDQGINVQQKIDILQKTSKDEINSVINNYLDQRPRLKEVQEMNEQKTAIQAIGEGDRQTLGNKMADTVGQALPAIVAGFATKNPMLVFGTVFPQMKDEITEDLTNDKSLNLSTQQINKLSTGIGAISTLVETVSSVIQLGPLMKPFTKEITNQLVRKAVTKGVISQGLVQMLKGMGSEGVEEVIQSAIQNLTAIGLGSDRDFLELKEYASIFLESAILSLGISLPGGVMQSIQQKKLNDMIKQNPNGVKTVEEFLDYMNQTVVDDIDDDDLPPSAGMIEQAEMDNVDQTKYQTIQSAIPENTRTGIQKYKKARIEDVIDKFPDISVNKDIVIKDIQGDKFTITEGTPLTPYQMVGGKVLLQNGTTYIVPNNQFQNLKNQSTVLEAKEFAPELKGTEETVLSARDYGTIDLSEEGAYESLPQDVRDVVESYGEDLDYKDLESMKSELKRIGWEADYDLDGTVTSLSQIDQGKPTKYEKYTLPGGDKYREVLIKTTDNSKKMLENKGYSFVRGIDGKIIVKKGAGLVIGTRPNMESAIQSQLRKKEKPFQSSHRDDKNVLAHLRLNEREYNGQKVMFMEELQSDWAREARKNQPKTTEEKQADKDFVDYAKSMWEKYGDDMNRLNTTRSLITRYGTTDELVKFNELEQKTVIRDTVPQNELLKNRQTLAIKRALFEAAENGSEYFSWINGEETAARYSLEKHIDSIGWETNKQYETYGFKVIKIKPKQGSRIDLIINKDGKITDAPKSEREGKNVSDVIGKGLAEQIMGNNEGTIDGNGLKIGGERAYNMYDKQVPNIVKDLTGQTPEKIDLGIKPEQPSPGLYIRTDNGVRSITNNDIKVGISFENGDNREFVIVEVLGDGKFKAVPRIILQPAARRGSLAEGVDWTPVNIRTVEYYYNPKNVSEISLPKQREPQQFQSIKLTPEVKAIIKGQAPLRAKPSGKALEDIFVPELYQLFKKATKQPISKEEALKIVRKYFDANELSVYFAQKISTPEGLLAFGKYVKGVITFIENPDISTPRHEVVHAYLDLFVSPQRKAEILADVKNSVAYKDYLNGKKPTMENAEEFLADLGNEYMMKKELPSNIGQKIIDFLRDLLQSFKKFFGKEDKMVDLFNDIMNKNRDYISDKFGDMTKYEDFGDNTKSQQFKAWFGDWETDPENASKVVNSDGEPLVVYHGTVNEFTVFDREKASVESDMGAGFYFTDNEDDVSVNYEGGGPDFEIKVDRLAERIESDSDGKISYEQAKIKARKELGENSNKLEVYLDIKNPLVIGGNKETTLFEIDTSDIVESDFDSEDAYYEELDNAINDRMQEFFDDIGYVLGNYNITIDDLYDIVGYGEGISASKFIEELKKDDSLNSAEDPETGDFAANEVIRSIFERLGYDGIIDNTVYDKFGHGRRNGQPMDGIDYDTAHYIVFNPNQIKSATENVGTYNPYNPDIRYQSIEEFLDSMNQVAVEDIDDDYLPPSADDFDEAEYYKQIQREIAKDSDPEYDNFAYRVYQIEKREQRLGYIANKKIQDPVAKQRQKSEFTRDKEKLISRIGEYYGIDQFEAVDKYDEFTNLDIDYLESLSAPRKKYKPKTEMEKQLKKQLLLKKEEVEQKKIEQQEKKLDEQIQQRIEPKKKRLITPKEGPAFGKVDKYDAAKYFTDKTDIVKPELTIKQQEKKVEKIINKTTLPELKYNDNSIWYNIKKIYRRALDNFAIGRYGEEGKEIFEKVKQAEKRSVIKASDDIVKLDKALKPLSDEEMADFGGYVEKKIAIPNDKVQNAVNVWNTVSNNIASYAQQYGLQIKTPEGYRDFIPRQNYYPYYIKEDILTERLSNKEKYRELINKIAEENKITIAEAADFLRMLANNKADFFGHLERSRGANLPSQFYERDPRNILAAYIGKGYDRLGIIKEFGAKDEILNDLISEAMKKGEDVEEIKLLSDVLLGRKEYHIAASKVSNTLRMYNNITKLSLAAVTNLGDIIKPFVRTNPISALIGIKDTFTKKGQEFGAKVGVTNTLLENYATEQGLGNKFFKRSGFKKSEETLRKISANAARNYLDVLWKKLEKNPNNKFARRRIEQFGINPQDLIENGGPTESDYIEAGYQSIADTQPTSKTDMPYYFQTPAGKVLTQYKQFAYKHFNFAKKFIFAELGKGNVVPLLMFLILGQAVGEGVADLKAFIRGRDRVGTIGKRIIDNYITVGGLGLATDFITAIQNQGYGSPFLKFIVGPTFSDMDAILTAIVGDINSLKKGKDFVYGKVAGTGQTQFKTLKNALNKLPFVGPFLANKIMPTNAPYQARTPGLTDDILQLLGIEQDLEQSNNTSLKKKVTKKPTKKKVTKKK